VTVVAECPFDLKQNSNRNRKEKHENIFVDIVVVVVLVIYLAFTLSSEIYSTYEDGTMPSLP
jgi:hypothetical protein